MKLLELRLHAFGPFTDPPALDFTMPAAPGLHLVCGLNEAGKSSALRAVTALLFGYERGFDDAFLHPQNKLNIAAVLENGSGEKILIARKKQKNQLFYGEAGDAAGDEILTRFLGGVKAAQFRDLFGFDHRRLREGGAALVNGGGDLGETLFAAGAGIERLHALRKRIETRLAELFSPAASKKTINKFLGDYEDAAAEVRSLSLSGTEYNERRAALERMEQERRALADRHRALAADKSRLERLLGAIPSIVEKQQTLAALAALETTPDLPAGFFEDWRATCVALDRARTQARDAARDIQELEEQIAGLSAPESLLARGAEIDEAVQHIRAFRNHTEALAEAGLRAAVVDAEIAALAAKLAPESTPELADSLRVPVAALNTIRDLAHRHEFLHEAARHARDELADLDLDIAAKQQTLAAAAPFRDVQALSRALVLAQEHIASEDRSDDLARERETLRNQAGAEASSLGWTGALEELERVNFPSPETVDLFKEKYSRADNALDAVAKRLEEEQIRLRDRTAHLQQTDPCAKLVDEADLKQARAVRDQAWQLIQRDWLHHEDVARDAKALDPETPLHLVFEQSMAHADDLADRLRRDAESMERTRTLMREIDERRQAVETLQIEKQNAESACHALRLEWDGLWAGTGIETRPPAEMAGWLRRLQGVRDLCAQLRNRDTGIRAARDSALLARQTLECALRDLGEPVPPEGARVRALAALCRDIQTRLTDANNGRLALETALAGLQANRTRAANRMQAAAGALDKWSAQWNAALAAIPCLSAPTPAAAEQAAGDLESLFSKLDSRAALRDEIARLQQAVAEFESRIRNLANKAAPDLEQTPAAAAALELGVRLAAARKSHTLRGEKSERLDASARNLAAARDQEQVEAERLRDMAARAGCNAGDMGALEERCARKRALRERLDRARSDLDARAREGGLDASGLEAAAADQDVDALRPRISELEQGLEELDRERQALSEAVGREQSLLADMDRGAGAAGAAARVQSVLGELRAPVEEYARLKAASRALHDAVEQWLEHSRGPALNRASVLFAALTRGSFSGLRTEFDDAGRTVITGLRGSGEIVPLAGMSDGAADQLYLALRIAALEQHMQAHEPMPFILDDVLVHFDDLRSAAALSVFADLARRTQVIFFTHHEHLAHVARGAVPGDVLKIHHLAS